MTKEDLKKSGRNKYRADIQEGNQKKAMNMATKMTKKSLKENKDEVVVIMHVQI